MYCDCPAKMSMVKVILGESFMDKGVYNIEDTEDKYIHIAGNGLDLEPSNAHTLDWDGNAWYQGHIYTGGTGQNDGMPIGGLVRCSYSGNNTTATTFGDYLTNYFSESRNNFSSYSEASKFLQN